MPTLSSLQLPPPKNWQDFELLCCDLWRAIWRDPNTQRNGRQGQPQQGVDVFGRPNLGDSWAGIQCKGKDSYSEQKLNSRDVRNEVKKARCFQPTLSEFIIATTGPRDAKLQTLARRITQEAYGQFNVSVWCWEDIVDALDGFPDVVAKHYPQFAHTAILQELITKIHASQQQGSREQISKLERLAELISARQNRKTPSLFICYRRKDNPYAARCVYERLAKHFGEEAVFYDVETILPGMDFREILGQAVAQCDLLLAVIGDKWLSQEDHSQQRRLDSPDDFVRIEIEAAIYRGIPVVPVLVDGTCFPRTEDLPPSLGPLAGREAVEVRSGRDFEDDLNTLVLVVERSLASQNQHATSEASEQLSAPSWDDFVHSIQVALWFVWLCVKAIGRIVAGLFTTCGRAIAIAASDFADATSACFRSITDKTIGVVKTSKTITRRHRFSVVTVTVAFCLSGIAFSVFRTVLPKNWLGETVCIICPSSGSLTGTSIDVMNGAILAVEEHNLFDKYHQIEIQTPEVAAEDHKARSALDELQASKNVQFVIGGFFSDQALVLGRWTEKEGLVVLSPSADGYPSQERRGNLFRICISQETVCTLMGRHLAKGLGKRRAAIFEPTRAAGVFQTSFTENGGEVFRCDLGATGFSPQILRWIRSAERQAVDCVVLPSPGVVSDDLRGDLRDECGKRQIALVFLLFDGILDDYTGCEVVAAVGGFTGNLGGEKGVAFRGSYAAKYRQPATEWAALGYDAASVGLEAWRRNGYRQVGLEQHLLTSPGFQGVTGRLKFSPTGDVQKTVVIRHRVANGTVEEKTFNSDGLAVSGSEEVGRQKDGS